MKEVNIPKVIANYSGKSISLIPNTVYSSGMDKWISIDGMISRTIPSYGELKTTSELVDIGKIKNFPLFKKVVTYIDDLPDVEYDYIVVTREYAEALDILGRDTSKLLLISDPITLSDGETYIGCRGLIPYDHNNSLFGLYMMEEEKYETV
ncbi:MAG: hypothetical protein IKA36_00180 [Clostridia bacterium]|nr:hypothetical protein [Clostridia bacterium]